MWVFFTFNVVHVNIYEAKPRYVFVHNCIIIIPEFSFFNGSLPQKKFVKVIEDDILTNF